MLFNVVNPPTFNAEIIVVLFDKVVAPEVFNDENNVKLLFNFVIPDTYNDADNKVSPLVYYSHFQYYYYMYLQMLVHI